MKSPERLVLVITNMSAWAQAICWHLLFPVNAVLLDVRNTDVLESINAGTGNPSLI